MTIRNNQPATENSLCNHRLRRLPLAAVLLTGTLLVGGIALAGEAPTEPAPVEPAPPPGLQAVPAKVTTIDGRILEGDIVAADATSLTLDVGQAKRKIALADTIEVNFEPEKRQKPPTGLQVLFLDGSALNVEKIPGATEDTLKVKSAAVGDDLSLPIDHIMGVVFDLNAKKSKEYRDAIMTRQADRDFVLLPNLDSVTGKLDFASWKDRAVKIAVDDKTREFKEEEAAGLKLQVLAEKLPVPPLHVEATLIDDSELVGTVDSVRDGKLVLDVQGAKLPLITGGIRTLRIVGSRMKYLSDLEPDQKEEYPLLKSLPTAYPMHKNRTAAGKPISLNSKSYDSGLGVHAYSHLTFSLNQQFEGFYTLVGIDDNMAKPGKVQYQVLVDGEVRKTGTLSSRRADTLEVDVKGARKLELIVNFGDDSDTGDSVVWANARLIKKE